MYGKLLRMARIRSKSSGRICIVPMDHGTTYGPLNGIDHYIDTIGSIIKADVDAIVLHKGLLMRVSQYPELAKGNYIMHLSASTALSTNVNYKILVASVEEAIKLGAIGVSVHINLGTANETEMIKDLGIVSKACVEWGMPLLAMMYSFKGDQNVENVLHAARLAEEMGADIVKINYTGSIQDMKRITERICVPILIAGGSKQDNFDCFLDMLRDSIYAGAAGVAVGRNIFQSEDPAEATKRIVKLINEIKT